MAKTSTNHHQPPLEGRPTQRKPSWLLYVLAGVIVIFLLQKIGCGPVQVHEKSEWIDR